MFSGRRSRWIVLVAALLLVAGGATAVALTQGTSSHNAPAAAPTTTATTKKPPKHVAPAVVRCPLTGLPAPYATVPKRPALMVKIGNEPGPARPQSGLNEADIVYDTPAEGFIMRYVAVYQCGNATRVGPMRSVRWVDYHLAPQFGSPILAFAGGIDWNTQTVAGLPWLGGANVLMEAQSAAFRTSDRLPPDNLYSSTSALYGLFPQRQQPPGAAFKYTHALPASSLPLASAELFFSGGTDVVWQWQPASHTWLHTYGGAPDVDTLTNTPVTATNVVVQVVQYHFGPVAESIGSTGDVESGTIGNGLGFVLRDGRYIPVAWHRGSDLGPLWFTTPSGAPVGLAPGRTWVEIMTNSQAANGIHFTP